MKFTPQPWIHSITMDGLFILLPPFITLLVIAFLPSAFKESGAMPTSAWIVLVLLVDVAHVHSTLYRTYFDKETFAKHKLLLINIPLLAFIGAVMLYTIGALFFWRVVAYIAVFHFIRQQYGFMRIYSRKDTQSFFDQTVDKAAIYSATIFPLLYWHLAGQRNFDWFISGDFMYFSSQSILFLSSTLYLIILSAYISKEFYRSLQTKTFNWPKNLVIAGTYLSWFFGIIYYNGDVAFTALNVVSHGVPYMALVWIYGRKRALIPSANISYFMRMIFSRYGLVLFLLIIFVLAYVEEGLWDAMVWTDHKNVFNMFYVLPHALDSVWLSIIVPLLILPQLTHYILDGFIWKIHQDDFTWKKIEGQLEIKTGK